MRSLVGFFLGCTLAVGSILPLYGQPPSGSQLPREENGCALCHGEAKLWKGEQTRLYVSQESLADDIHQRHGVNCHDCHGGDPASLDIENAHATEPAENTNVLPFRSVPEGTWQSCATCHSAESLLVRKSVHAHAEKVRENEPGRQLSCRKCHGEKAHGMRAVKDEHSPVYLDHQVRTCGGCHEDFLKSYLSTVHAQGLFEAGLVMTAVCADCHGAHGTYYAADRRSTLFPGNVAATCGKCHEGIEQRLQKSVHGRESEQEMAAAPPGKKWKRKPTCTSCHQGHEVAKTESNKFRAEIANQCGNCHPDLTGLYAMSTHGELTALGYTAAAKCSDCHGAHDILPLDDPNCTLAKGENRLATCRQCHVHAVKNFSDFDPHANHKNAEKYPLLHLVYAVTHGIFLGFLAFFLVHGFLWFVRSFLAVLFRGRHRTLVTGQYVLQRHTPANRIIYLTLLVAFLGLTVTGLPLKYSMYPWAVKFVQGLGGFESTSVWHHFFGTVAIGCCVAHLIGGISAIRELRRRGVAWRAILFGPDSPIPSWRDVKDLFGMVRWFFGLGAKPRFERWTYWEKYDYWMAYLACLLIGTSGLMMWYPNLFCRFFSGEMLNVARLIHVELAVLATSFLFVFHFFHTHFRPEKFPMDLSAITGLVSEDHLRKNRPEYVARLEATHQIDAMRRPAPSRKRLWVVFLAGMMLYSAGLFLLAVALTASLGK